MCFGKCLAEEPVRSYFCAFTQSVEFRPNDVFVNAPTQTAVGRSDYIFFTYYRGELFNALRHELWVFHQICGMRDDAGIKNLAFWDRYFAPDFPLVSMTRVRRLKRVSTHIEFKEKGQNMLELNIGGVRTVSGAPTQVETHLISGDAFECIILGFYRKLGEFEVLLKRRLWNQLVPRFSK